MRALPYFFSAFIAASLFAIEINPLPLQEVEISKPKFCPESCGFVYVNEMPRKSTCTGVAWLPDEAGLIAAHFDYGTLNVYEFDSSNHEIKLTQIVESSKELNLQSVENLAISPDGRWVAISINHRKSIIVFEYDKKLNQINTSNYFKLDSPDRCCHGINFSRDSQYLLFTTLRPNGAIHICKFTENKNKFALNYLRKIPNEFYPFKPKSIDFSFNDEYLTVVLASNVTKKQDAYKGKIAVYKFDKIRGDVDLDSVVIFDEPEVFKGGDDIRFYKDSYTLIASEQSEDRISVYEFDPTLKIITKSFQELTRETSNISLPHGICVSPSGKFLAVCNYGHNNFSIFEIR